LQDQDEFFDADCIPVRSSGDDTHIRAAPAQGIDPVSEHAEAPADARRP
jgi:hypothetical protein